jgi:hypothetical protein
MSSTRTADEVREHYLQKMGQLLGLVFYRLWNETVWLHIKWHTYVTLFGSSPERVALLNQAAPMSFRVIQDSLWDDVLLHICGLTDPPQSGGQENLTVRKLPGLVDAVIGQRVRDLLSVVRDRVAPLRERRNKVISHRDLLMATNQNPHPLPDTSRETVRAALAALVNVMNAVESHYCDQSETMYEAADIGSDASALVHVLQEGLEARTERHQRIRQ